MVSSPLMTHPAPLPIKINDYSLNEVCELKFLGICIDNKLNRKDHVDMIKSKITLLTSLIYRLRYLLNEDCLRQIYHILIYSHLAYCSAIWGGAYKTYINNIFITQKNFYASCSLRTVTTIPTVFSATQEY